MTAASPDAVTALAEFEATEREQRNAGPPAREWPTLDGSALHGLAGEVVGAIEPHSESDPVAILVGFLVAFGSAVGRGPHFRVEATRHGCNESAVLVGDTSKARKGTSWDHVRGLLESVDEHWSRECVAKGLSSGEGLIWAIRDPIERFDRPRRTKDNPHPEAELVVVDPGVEDKRLLVVESEFATPLKVMERDGNTLSPVLRDAWDGVNLRSLVKNSPARATDPHISVLGHITTAELRRHFAETEAANGFGNRVMWFMVRRSKMLPEGGRPDPGVMAQLARQVGVAVGHARRSGELRRDPRCREVWAAIYPELSADRAGLLGAVVARAEAHVTRLALLYALLDEATEVRVEHLGAALNVWRFAEASAEWIFGDSLGDEVADQVLQLIRAAGPEGATRTDMHNALGRHVQAHRLNLALEAIQAAGRARAATIATAGRSAQVWTAR